MNDDTVAGLIKAAWLAREAAYAPYSNFSVGAAILAESGMIFKGCNVENISYGLTICAERAAAVAAIQAGERGFLGIAIAAKTEVPIVPCGACRQFLAEFAPDLLVISAANREPAERRFLSELLPFPKEGILSP